MNLTQPLHKALIERPNAEAMLCGGRQPQREPVLRFTNELTNEIDGIVRQARRKPQPSP